MTDWMLPDPALLVAGQPSSPAAAMADPAGVARALRAAGADSSDVTAEIGPQAIRYLVTPEAGVAPRKFEAATDSLAVALGTTVRYAGPVGRAVAFEAVREVRQTVALRDVLPEPSTGGLRFAVGAGIGGAGVVGDLASLPHLLVAGTTGSGKSVFMNSLLTALLMAHSPADLRMVMVDVKRVELAPYAPLPHLLRPIVTEPDDAVEALRFVVAEMDRRFSLFEDEGVKKIEEYNALASVSPLARWVLVVDELGDLMSAAPKAVEAMLVRIGRLARAAGIHMVLATQRPTVKTVTGDVKANIIARAVFAVASSTDSMVALDQSGAQRLAGRGDGLWTTGLGAAQRFQAPLVTDEEVARVVKFWATQKPVPVAKPRAQEPEEPRDREAEVRRALDALPWSAERQADDSGDDVDSSMTPHEVLMEAGLNEVAVEALIELVVNRVVETLETALAKEVI